MKWVALEGVAIHRKLVVILMITSGLVLFTASIGFVIWDYFRFRTDMANHLSTQAMMVLEHSRVAMSFNDAETARETLVPLGLNPHIQLACLYEETGELFVDLRSPRSSDPCPGRAPPVGRRFTSTHLELVATQNTASSAATVLLRSDLDEVTSRAEVLAMTIAAVLALSLLVAFALSTYLQRIVSAPIIGLATTARDVSERGDYSLRATKTTKDELGVLVDAFNGMLDHIQRAEMERGDLLVREQEANRLKDEFLATLSHELRTPLNAILGWTHVARAGMLPAAELERALERIERNAQAQSGLINDLLEVSRITTGQFRLDPRHTDLVTVVNNAIEAIGPTAAARRVTIERRIAASTLPTIADPDRLQQVVWNLISNAVRFTPAAGQVTVTLTRHDDVDELRVSDTGIGIDPAFLPSVFETFRQADASSTRTHGGLGLGLAIVRRITDLHGGQVTAESAGRGHGATFVVRLPVRTPDHTPVEAAGRPPARVQLTKDALDGISILVVDDDQDTRELLRSVLSAAGASVRTAASADEALTSAVEQPPTALISDIAMPGTDGYSFMEQLHDLLGARSPRIAVALTAFAAGRDRQRILAAGFQRHIPKPFDPTLLVQTLRELHQRTA
jgi:signal transduction histidine kinase/ActR/RegA family two-component response regulator